MRQNNFYKLQTKQLLMINNKTAEQYLVEPEILETINFVTLEKQINETLIFELKELKSETARIIFMSKEELIIITSKIKPEKIWKYIKKIKGLNAI
jgi:hypothetical protein